VAGADVNQAAAPPVDTAGGTTGARVGAHLAHVNRNGLSVAWSCATCHGTQDTTHPSGGATKMAFTGVAGSTSTYAAGTCTTYCHARGGSTPTPSWTGAAMNCGSCHAATPPAPHVQRTDCGTCHTGYTTTTVNAATHVNGVVNVNTLACNTCHGSAANAAPPAGTKGETLASTRAVGAHQKHLVGGSIGAAMACTECHAVPTAMSHADGTVQLAWGPVARAGGANPSFVSTNLSCASTYCHGATLAAGGTNQAPIWTGGSSQATCGTCHGAPPPAPHSTSTACGSCHTGYTATTVNLATHVNGTLDVVAMTCTSCHGKAGRAATAAAPLDAAPPVDAAGASTGVRVGAHQKHLVGGTYANALSCATCHASVGTYTTSHPNALREVGFTGAANANLRRGTWTAGAGAAAGTCASTWCHGAVISSSNGPVGGTATTPSWTGTVTACTSCHAVVMTSLGGRHNSVSNHRGYACSVCHGTGYTATVTSNVATGTGVNKAAHVDGVRTIVTVASGTGIRTWNPTTRTCTASCHGSETW
jgi:predicted CxxxxCH...CXXCH cytochrome family protein